VCGDFSMPNTQFACALPYMLPCVLHCVRQSPLLSPQAATKMTAVKMPAQQQRVACMPAAAWAATWTTCSRHLACPGRRARQRRSRWGSSCLYVIRTFKILCVGMWVVLWCATCRVLEGKQGREEAGGAGQQLVRLVIALKQESQRPWRTAFSSSFCTYRLVQQLSSVIVSVQYIVSVSSNIVCVSGRCCAAVCHPSRVQLHIRSGSTAAASGNGQGIGWLLRLLPACPAPPACSHAHES
jgi:hypothetical protein